MQSKNNQLYGAPIFITIT